MRVLIVSAFIDPDVVGEPRWCYDLARGLSDRLETIVLSQSPVRGSRKVADFLPNARVIETPGWKLDFLDKRVRALVKPNYFKFYRFAKRVIDTTPDLRDVTCAHHFGPLGMRYPTPLRNTGIPYIVGPVGGSLPLPPGFLRGETKDPWYYKLRDVDSLRFRHDPSLRSSYGKAEVLVGAGDYVKDVLRDVTLKRFIAHSQRIAPPPRADIDAVLAARAASPGPFRLLIASRLIYSKGIHLALQALGAVKDRLPDWRLDVLGEGVYREELERLAATHGIDSRVTFHGHRPRSEVDDFYRAADVFLFPTIREPSGTVIFEAMSWGVPIIAADYGGPATHVDVRCGIKVPVTSPEDFVRSMADAIVRLARDPDERARMGRTAVTLAAEKHSITEMIDFFVDLYRQIGRPR